VAAGQIRPIACAVLAGRVFGFVCMSVGREVETMKSWFEKLIAWFKGEDDMTAVERLRRLQNRV